MDYKDKLEIDLLDLCHYLMKKWRACLIFLLAGMLAFGLIGYLKVPENVVEEKEQETTVIDVASLSEGEIEDVNEAVELYFRYQNLYAARKYYGADSVKMSIDPNHVSTITKVFVIRDYTDENSVYVSDTNEADNIVELYKRVISSNEVLDEVQKTLGWSLGNRLVRELFSLTKSGLNVMVLAVYGPDEATCRTIAGILEKAIMNSEHDVQLIQKHSLEVLNDNYSEEFVSSFADAQKTQLDTLATIEKNMNSIEGTLNDLEKPLYKALVQELKKSKYASEDGKVDLTTVKEVVTAMEEGNSFSADVESISDKEPLQARKLDLKYILIGAVAGIFLMLLIYSVFYIFSPNLKTREETSAVFNLSLLGGVIDNASERAFSGIDRFVDSIFTKGRPKFTEDENLDMITSAISISASKEKAAKVFVAGTTCDKAVESFANKIIEELNKNAQKNTGLTLETGHSPLFDPRSLESLSGMDAVVLVERIGVSRYDDIAKLIELCHKYDINIFGSVVIDR